MKEIKDIVSAFEKARQQGRRTALATVVHVDGSSYRRPGARMLVTEEGALTGAISGGCLEGDALRKALFALSRQQSMLVTYDTTDEDDARLGVGLGCNGIIQVLFEPINPGDPNNPIELLKIVALKRQASVLVTLFSLENKRGEQPGTRLLLKEDGIISSMEEGHPLARILLTDAQKTLETKTSSFKHYVAGHQSMHAFLELVKPAPSLVVVGAGNDVIPLVKMADTLGWEISIADGRSSYARPERFVSSCRVLLSKPENLLEKLSIDERTAFVLMTHNYNYDLAMLKELLKRKVAYIGSLGPRKKLDRMLADLKEEGILPDKNQLSCIYGPAGLDLGAGTPEEIALSILAEIQAVLSNREGKSLREQQDVIHPRGETAIEKIQIEK